MGAIRGWRGVRLLVIGALTLTLAACTSPARPWAAAGEDFFSGLRTAYAVGFTNLAPFYAPDVAVDYVGISGGAGVGRIAAVQLHRDDWQSAPAHDGVSNDNRDTVRMTPDEPLYLSADGAVDPTRLFADSYVIPSAFIYSIGRSGIESETFTGSIGAAETYYAASPTVLKSLRAFAEDYVRAWSSTDPGGVAALYASHAVVRDSLAGVRLEGASAIAAAAKLGIPAGGLQSAVMRTIPENGGSALYFDLPTPVAVVLLDVGDCPGQVAVVLHYAEGKITGEERYHRVDAARRCAPPTGWPGGWWDQVSIPRPDAVTRTGNVTAQGSRIAIWNGTAGMQRLLTWALQRYADAALPIPTPTSITFLPDADSPARYGFGHAGSSGDRALGFAADSACLDSCCSRWTGWAKAATLHELSYSWLAHHATLEARHAFLRDAGLRWNDPARPWAQQGLDVAAEILTWGLMDEPYRTDVRLGHPSCQQLARWFLLLTATDPDPRSCAEPVAAPGGSRP